MTAGTVFRAAEQGGTVYQLAEFQSAGTDIAETLSPVDSSSASKVTAVARAETVSALDLPSYPPPAGSIAEIIYRAKHNAGTVYEAASIIRAPMNASMHESLSPVDTTGAGGLPPSNILEIGAAVDTSSAKLVRSMQRTFIQSPLTIFALDALLPGIAPRKTVSPAFGIALGIGDLVLEVANAIDGSDAAVTATVLGTFESAVANDASSIAKATNVATAESAAALDTNIATQTAHYFVAETASATDTTNAVSSTEYFPPLSIPGTLRLGTPMESAPNEQLAQV